MFCIPVLPSMKQKYCFRNISTFKKLVPECSHCFKASKITLVKNLLKLIETLYNSFAGQ